MSTFLDGFGVDFSALFGCFCCSLLFGFRSQLRARGEEATPSNLMTLTRDLQLFPKHGKMKQRSKPVRKHANVE